VDLETSAQLLDIRKESLQQALQSKKLQGIEIGEEWRLSLFEMARMLGASPEELMEYWEDFALAEKIEEVEADAVYGPEEGRAVYEQYLRGKGVQGEKRNLPGLFAWASVG